MAKTTFTNRTWLQGPNLSLLGGGIEPHYQTDWPTPHLSQRQPPPPHTGFTLGINNELRGGGIEPFYQLDWPVPKGWPPLHQSWVENLNLALSEPFYQLDWPNPKGWPSLHQAWVENINLALSGGGIEPFYQLDWPDPHWLYRPPPHVGIVQGADLNLFGGGAEPFYQLDWPVPKGWPPRLDWIQGTDLSLFGGGLEPFYQTDWPLPGRPRGIGPDHLVSAGITIHVVTSPFFQVDWPLPPLRAPSAHVGWAPPVNTSLLGAGVMPSAMSVWMYTSIPAYILVDAFPVAAGQPTQNNAVMVGLASPFAQYDWPLPVRRPITMGHYVANDESSLNDLFAITTTPPFGNHDWPLPIRRTPTQGWMDGVD